MTPAKPLPIETPATSTYWPGTKWSGESSWPTSSSASAETRNSTSLRVGFTLALAK